MSLFTKYRPKRYEDVIGQDHITVILRGLVNTGNAENVKSVVFGGSPGSGKTTLGRIYAKAINCKSPVDGEPCNKCEHCRQFEDENYPDYIEIDAATYNKVEDVRTLLDLAKQYPIVKDGTRIILMDEAHALSNQAWDILLKYLEEGDNPTNFIFATTEPNKIRPAILSRSYVFRVKPLNVREIEEELIRVCEEEGIEYDDSSIYRIASSYKGKMRDALKLIDMYANSTGSIIDVTVDTVDSDILEAILKAYTGDMQSAYDIIDEMNTIGVDIQKTLYSVLNTLYIYPKVDIGNLSEREVQSAQTLLDRNTVKDIMKQVLKYQIKDTEALKLFLNIVTEFATIKDSLERETKFTKRRLREKFVKQSNVDSKPVITEKYKSKKEMQDENEVRNREELKTLKLLSKYGFKKK